MKVEYVDEEFYAIVDGEKYHTNGGGVLLREADGELVPVKYCICLARSEDECVCAHWYLGLWK